MAKAVIAYDKDLPEIPGRRPWEKPSSYLVKDDAAPTGWREERKEWAIEHRCKIEDVIEDGLDEFDRLLHGFPFVDEGGELMFAELTNINAY